jgi:sulfatase maturation enzyme AslB (radical SAM superfamily)
MKKAEVFKAWGRILTGYCPSMSIEITRECPLRCPGCYAYEPEHLGGVGPLRSLADQKGQELIDGVLNLVSQYRPLHLSLVGGEPLVRFRELNVLLPRLSKMGIGVQLVTSAVRPIPKEWAQIDELYIAVSVDGLQPEHDERRKPATYDRILKGIEGHRVTIHCTVTRQMTKRSGYFEEFLTFWSNRTEVKKIWFSLFTPQVGADDDETLSQDNRTSVLQELVALRSRFSKLYLPDTVVEGYRNPPQSPNECIFARTTLNFTADLKNKITPCQFGGKPDCTQCGCMASAGLNAIGNHTFLGVPIRRIFEASDAIGKKTAQLTGRQI